MRQITFSIAAGTVSSNLAWFPLCIDLGKFGAGFWDYVSSTGGDLRAYDGTTRLPLDIVFIDKTNKQGAIYVRTPIAAAGQDVLIHYDLPAGSLQPAPTDPYGAYSVWAGYDYFCDFRGAFVNRVDGSSLLQSGTIDEGDGPPRWLKLNGNGYVKATGKPNRANFTMGGVSQKNAGPPGHRAIMAYSSNDGDKTKTEAVFYSHGGGYLASINSVFGEVVGDTFAFGTPYATGVIYDGSARRFYDNGALKATQYSTVNTRGTLFVGAQNDGTDFAYPLVGAVMTAWIYNGVLTSSYFEAEYKTLFVTDATVPTEDGDTPEPDMPILFAGTSIADVLPIAGTSQATTASAWLPPSGFVAEGITATSTTTIFRAEFAPATEFWASCWVFSNTVSYTANTILLKFGSPSGGDEFALRVPAAGLNVRFDYNNAGAWAQIAPAFAFDNSRCRIDLYYKRDAINGRLQLYRDGVLVFDFTGNTAWTAAPALTRFDMSATSGNGSTWSAIIVHTQDTRKFEFVQLRPNGNGAETAWIGDYTAVDETGYSDTDIISSDTAGQVETFLFPDLPAGYDAYAIAGVVVAMRAQGSGVPGEINGVARIGGVVYEQTPVDPLNPSWGPHKVIFENNPATSAGWTQPEINAAEFGVKSVTP